MYFSKCWSILSKILFENKPVKYNLKLENKVNYFKIVLFWYKFSIKNFNMSITYFYDNKMIKIKLFHCIICKKKKSHLFRYCAVFYVYKLLCTLVNNLTMPVLAWKLEKEPISYLIILLEKSCFSWIGDVFIIPFKMNVYQPCLFPLTH